MTATVLHGDAAALPLPDASVDLIVTSPPYWSMRSYRDGGEHYAGQIGAEPTPAQYIDSLITCTREWMRVLKPTGSLWVNLGDKYAQTVERSRNGHSGALVGTNPLRDGPVYSGTRDNGVPRKSLIGLPWRYALRCIDDLGLSLRAEVIWSKANALPESVTDRVRRSHEQWFHFTQQPRYFAAVDAIRQPHNAPPRAGYGRARPPSPGGNRGLHVGRSDHATHRDMGQNALGALPGSVWSLASEPLKVPAELGVDHFAAFPTSLPLRIIAGWSPSGICTACGEGRRPITGRVDRGGRKANVRVTAVDDTTTLGRERIAAITGEACGCAEPDAPTTRAVVLDPFGGTGTTALVASVLGRVGISVDKSLDYCRLAQWRTNDPRQRERVARKAASGVVQLARGAYEGGGRLEVV